MSMSTRVSILSISSNFSTLLKQKYANFSTVFHASISEDLQDTFQLAQSAGNFSIIWKIFNV